MGADMKYAWTAILTLGLASAAIADEVLLKNGRTIVGIAHEDGGRVVVETRLGDIGFPKADVESIIPGTTPLHEYQERLSALDNTCATPADIFGLASWAREQGLVRYVHGLLQRTIEADPDHAEARRLLGFVRYEDRWVMASERDAVMECERRAHETRSVRPLTVPVRRTTRKPETVPYSLGIPPGPPRRGSTNYGGGYGGYPFWPVGVVRVFTAPVPATGSLR